MDFLKLIALDHEDLTVISAHMQDAQLCIGDMTYIPEKQRFVLAARRALHAESSSSIQTCYSGVHFDRVKAVRLLHIDQSRQEDVLTFIGILFEAENPPGGKITLLFKNDKSIQLDVECIEVQFRDFPMTEHYPLS